MNNLNESFSRSRLRWLVTVIIICMFTLTPLVWIISLSLKPAAYINDGKLIPSTVTLDNYREVFTHDSFGKDLINSIGIGLIATFIAVIVGMLAAYAISRLEFRGKKLLWGAVLLIAMFPQVSLITPLFTIEKYMMLFDTWLGLIIPYITFALPLAVFTMTSFFSEIPKELEKSAVIDGASPRQVFTKVIAPLAVPGVVTAAILVFITCWNDLLLAMSLSASNRSQTAPVAIANFTGSSEFEQPTGTTCAAAVIITIPIIIFAIVFSRRLVAGLTAGAVKG